MANAFWPNIDDSEDAKKVCNKAAGASFFVAIITAIVVWLQTSGKIKIPGGFNNWAYLDAGLFFLIGLGLTRRSRIAAILGLGLYIFERIMMAQATGFQIQIGPLTMQAVFIALFIGGVRGAFAYHAFRKQERLDEAQEPVLISAEGQAAEETPKKSKKGLVIFGISLLLIAAVIFAAAFFFFKKSAPSGGPSVSSGSSSAVSSGGEAVSGDEKVFHLRTGETVKGKIIREDETYYTVETFGGTQQYVIKEDIAKEG